MDRKGVKSTQIKSVGYDKASQTLEIEFQGRTRKKTGEFVPGAIWQFAPVPIQVVRAFANAPSKGRFFGMNIKNGYPAIKIFPVETPSEEETQKEKEGPAQGSLLESDR